MDRLLKGKPHSNQGRGEVLAERSAKRCTTIARFAFYLLVCLWGWTSTLAAQPDSASSTVCRDPGSTMLWEVQGETLDRRNISMHLFGSIHVGKPDFYPLNPRVESLFHAAGSLVFEVDPRSASTPQTAMQMQLRGLLPAGQRIDQVVSARTLADLEEVLASFNIPLENFASYKPWMITLILANLQVNAMGFEAAWGLEAYFMRQRDPATVILELESVQQQVDMLDNLDQDAFLGYSLREYAASAGLFGQLMSAWACADHEQLNQIMFAQEGTASLDEVEQVKARLLEEQLYTNRNQVMATAIEDFINTGNGKYFVVVGAGHLLGENSVIALLEQRGYQVIPVSAAP